MSYPFLKIEQKWQQYWKENKTFKALNPGSDLPAGKKKCYVLDMFPYPSGAGLHVGHPLGYIASDIYARFKRNQGHNVLHPMGYDAFGLPAEQYAIKTGVHPAKSTEENISRYKKQLEMIGLSFDWSRELRTCDPSYYKHTQKIFIQLFESWYDEKQQKARPVDELIKQFEMSGNESVFASHSCDKKFSASEWKKMSEKDKATILMDYRLAYLKEGYVNWCSQLGTVLANDEVKDGLSVRGGHPVEQKKMPQWSLRISAYADRLLRGLDDLNWPQPLKEMQRNWIGRSEGAQVEFLVDQSSMSLSIFTTRPDTLFGVSFMVVAPESEILPQLTQPEQQKIVENYLSEVKKKTERERVMETKKVSGVFTGSYCIHPFTKVKVPIWVSEYVLAGYGTGAIMAVPAHDERDYNFAKHFNLPILPVVKSEEKSCDGSSGAYSAKTGTLMNSDFLNGLEVEQAIEQATLRLEEDGIGRRKINYRLRDANFSRQRYWGEPIPIYFENGIARSLDESQLPLLLPDVDKYLPTEDGEPPLARAKNWKTKDGFPLETSTMPGFAGSSAYFLRYMDPDNEKDLVDRDVANYWGSVDLYLGGSEHATGHLLYSRFWNMFLYDMNVVSNEEPFQRLINQGMIQGRSQFVFRIKGKNTYVTADKKSSYSTSQIHVDVNYVDNDYLDIERLTKSYPEFRGAEFILDENGKYLCGAATEKMSKSFYNVINPDDIVKEYGADTLRLYEMFLGPLEQSKPWNTNGIEGVFRFLTKLYRHCYDEEHNLILKDVSESDAEKKVLHTLIKKVTQDIESLSLNTSVSAFMIALNDLVKLQCYSKDVFKDFIICLSPFAPHLSEQIWKDLGFQTSICEAPFPEWDESLLVESNYNYPISFNGKTRLTLELPIDWDGDQVKDFLMNHDQVKKYLEGKSIVKYIFVAKKIVNFVIKN